MLGANFSNNLYSVVKNTMAATGVSATLVCPATDSEYDPDTSSYVGTETTYPVRVIVMDFALISNGTLTDKGTLVISSDKQVYMDMTQSDGTQPPIKPQANGFKLIVGTTTYRITVVKEYNPSTQRTIMYDLKVEL